MKIRLENLKKLSIEELMTRCQDLRTKERKTEVALIAHLAELRIRRGFLDYGYNNIYAYCQQALGLDDGPSYLRMQVARVCQKFPQVLEMLENGELSLTAASKLSPALTSANSEELLKKCSGKKVREVSLIVDSLNPQKPVFSGVRATQAKHSGHQKSIFKNSVVPCLALSSEESKSPVAARESKVEEKYFNFRFTANNSLREKLLRLAEVMGLENMERNLAEILEESVDLALEKKDPQRKEERRQKREEEKKVAEVKGVVEKTETDKQNKKESRHIPSINRSTALKRSGYQCEKIGKGGVRCSARTRLQIDHKFPFGLGGKHQVENLQVLCQNHNADKAKQEYGYNFIAGKIASG